MTVKKAKKFTGRSEHTEQAIFMTKVLCEFPGLLIFAVPNGGHRAMSVAVKLKAEGVLAGVPDIYVEEARGGFFGYRIELKRVKHKTSINGGLSEDQLRIRSRLEAKGYKVDLCHGADAAMACIRQYMSLPLTFGLAPPRASQPRTKG